MAKVTTDKPEKKRSGLPMSEEQKKAHLKAFSDIDKCIEALKSCNKTKKALKCKK